MPGRGRPAATAARARASSSGSATRWGSTSRAIAASSVAPGGVVRLDDPRPRARPARRVVRSSSATCAASWASSAVLRKATAVWSASASSSRTSESAQRAAPGQRTSMLPRPVAAVPDRYDVRDRCPRRRGVAPVALTWSARPGPRRRRGRPARGHRPAGGLGHRRQQGSRGRRLGEAAAEVRQRLVGLGPGAVGQPVGEPDDLPAQRLEGQRDQRGRQQRQPEAARSGRPTSVADGDDQGGVADGGERRADRQRRRSG